MACSINNSLRWIIRIWSNFAWFFLGVLSVIISRSPWCIKKTKFEVFSILYFMYSELCRWNDSLSMGMTYPTLSKCSTHSCKNTHWHFFVMAVERRWSVTHNHNTFFRLSDSLGTYSNKLWLTLTDRHSFWLITDIWRSLFWISTIQSNFFSPIFQFSAK